MRSSTSSEGPRLVRFAVHKIATLCPICACVIGSLSLFKALSCAGYCIESV